MYVPTSYIFSYIISIFYKFYHFENVSCANLSIKQNKIRNVEIIFKDYGQDTSIFRVSVLIIGNSKDLLFFSKISIESIVCFWVSSLHLGFFSTPGFSL